MPGLFDVAQLVNVALYTPKLEASVNFFHDLFPISTIARIIQMFYPYGYGTRQFFRQQILTPAPARRFDAQSARDRLFAYARAARTTRWRLVNPNCRAHGIRRVQFVQR